MSDLSSEQPDSGLVPLGGQPLSKVKAPSPKVATPGRDVASTTTPPFQQGLPVNGPEGAAGLAANPGSEDGDKKVDQQSRDGVENDGNTNGVPKVEVLPPAGEVEQNILTPGMLPPSGTGTSMGVGAKSEKSDGPLLGATAMPPPDEHGGARLKIPSQNKKGREPSKARDGERKRLEQARADAAERERILAKKQEDERRALRAANRGMAKL